MNSVCNMYTYLSGIMGPGTPGLTRKLIGSQAVGIDHKHPTEIFSSFFLLFSFFFVNDRSVARLEMAWHGMAFVAERNGMENHENLLPNLTYLPYILESRFEDSLYLNYYRNRIY